MLKLFLRRDGDAWGLLSDVLRQEGIAPLPQVERGRWGKPFFPQRPGLHFNLSHSAGVCLCALADAPVGVDVEVVRPRRPGLPRYCLSDDEYGGFLAAGGGWGEFFRLWTLKEARCKQLGQALGQPRDWPVPPPCPHRSYWGDGFVAAVCAGEAPGELVVF